VKRALILLALAAIVALPFLLRPRRAGPEQAMDTLVVVTPNNEAIRHEFALGFKDWYQARTGRTVAVDWRVLGGTSEIERYLAGAYVGAFQAYWTGELKRPWSLEVQAGFQDGRLGASAPPAARQAREAFLQSAVGCGIDVFFGGGPADFDEQAAAGRLVDPGLRAARPDWFEEARLPLEFAGERFRDPQDRWFGSVVSSFGMIYNRDALRRLGFAGIPAQWDDLADPRFLGEVALCDPTKSGSIAMAFENLIQQRMQRRLLALEAASPGAPAGPLEARAVREGWLEGLQLIQRIGANARYFSDSSQKPPIDVADGDCAIGLCIDFYGTQQAEAVRRRGDSDRLGFAAPAGGTAYSVDPIGMLRGAPNAPVARAFIEYVLSLEGQKLWAFQLGVPGGPRDYALRRLPVRRDFYARADWRALRTDPQLDPYRPGDRLVYRAAWTGPLLHELAFVIRVMCQDTQGPLTDAWRAILRAPEPARSRALAALQDLAAVDYDRTAGEIKRALESRDRADELRLASGVAAGFRARYAAAAALAGGTPSD
jgi:ABC-type Fe3+ transport system substrate-binding protein